LASLAIAACLTPTDPILAAAVVGGKYADKHVPAHLRHLLAAESGCNDGAAFPFLYIALYLIIDNTTATAVKDWFLILWLCA
jgi:NhaP-type Na+/H+ or K+/H+ antiporter